MRNPPKGCRHLTTKDFRFPSPLVNASELLEGSYNHQWRGLISWNDRKFEILAGDCKKPGVHLVPIKEDAAHLSEEFEIFALEDAPVPCPIDMFARSTPTNLIQEYENARQAFYSTINMAIAYNTPERRMAIDDALIDFLKIVLRLDLTFQLSFE